MRVVLLFSVILCLLSPFTLAGSIQWTGAAGNGLWNFANNWLGNAVPTANDDVIIDALGGATVQVSQPAVAKSIKIGGGQYAQGLTLLSQLSVGDGGISLQGGGTLLVQSNNDLPLQSNGPVDFQAGSVFSFESGAIKGPGIFTVMNGATGSFTNAALKTLSAVTLVNNGTITIQTTTIQLSSAALFLNNVNITVVGAVTFLRDPSDTSDNKLQNNGQFIFQGKDSDLLTLQAPASFSTPLQIIGGSVTINDNFLSDSSIAIPQGSTLTVGAGPTTKQFGALTGEGIWSVQGIAIVTSSASVSTLEISDSGTLTLQKASSFVNVAIGGKLITSDVVSITDLGLDGGSLSGTGSVSVSANLSIQSSDTNNTNNFLSCPLTLNTNGNGESSTAVYLLLGQGGQFHIAQGASYSIINTFTVGSQGGKPSIIVDGTLSITNTGSQTFSSNVDFAGNGALKVNSGTLVFNGNTVTLGTITVSVSSFILFQTVALTVGTFSGAGGFNLTAAPSPVSTISTAPVTTIGIVNGNVNIGSFAASTFNLYSGTVTVPGSSSNTATTFNVYGGTLSGSAKLTTSALNLDLAYPFTLSGFVVKTTTLSIQAIGTGNIQLAAGATIISDSSSFASRSVHNNNININ